MLGSTSLWSDCLNLSHGRMITLPLGVHRCRKLSAACQHSTTDTLLGASYGAIPHLYRTPVTALPATGADTKRNRTSNLFLEEYRTRSSDTYTVSSFLETPVSSLDLEEAATTSIDSSTFYHAAPNLLTGQQVCSYRGTSSCISKTVYIITMQKSLQPAGRGGSNQKSPQH